MVKHAHKIREVFIVWSCHLNFGTHAGSINGTRGWQHYVPGLTGLVPVTGISAKGDSHLRHLLMLDRKNIIINACMHLVGCQCCPYAWYHLRHRLEVCLGLHSCKCGDRPPARTIESTKEAAAATHPLQKTGASLQSATEQVPMQVVHVLDSQQADRYKQQCMCF